MSNQANLEDISQSKEKYLQLGPESMTLPQNWHKTEFGDNFTHQRGVNYASKNYVEEGKGMIFLTLNSIAPGGGLKKDSLKYYDDDIPEKKKVESGEILMANTDLNQEGEIVGYPVKVPKFESKQEMCFSHHLLKIEQNEDLFNEQFLEYLFSSEYIHSRMIAFSCGSTVLNLNTSLLENLELPVPPKPEQRRIASVLYNVDQAIQKTEEIIEQTQRVKKGLMQDLFTEGYYDHEEFEEKGRFGEIPIKWDIKKLKNIAEVVGGSTPDTNEEQYWDGNIPWVTPTELTNLESNTIKETDRYITQEGLDSSSAQLLPPNSLLLTSRASIGMCAINEVEMATNQGFQSLVPEDEIDIWYLLYRMRFESPYLNSLGAGSTFSEVSNSMMKKVEVPLPEPKEQEKIGEILRAAEEQIFSLKKEKNQIQRLKKGLMQDLLTGEVRTDECVEVLDEVVEVES